jgi:hypothetical protein
MQAIANTSDRDLLQPMPVRAAAPRAWGEEQSLFDSVRLGACSMAGARDMKAWHALETACRHDLGLDAETLRFLLDQPRDYENVRRQLQGLRLQWLRALSTRRALTSKRPRVAMLLTEGQSIRTFLITDVSRKITEWADLFVLSPYAIRTEVAALGPNAYFLKIPSIRRSFFDYMVGYAGFRHTESPTIRQFMRRLEESLQKLSVGGTPARGSVRAWEIAKRFASYEDYRRAYGWSLRFFAQGYALKHVAGLLRDLSPTVLFNTSAVSWSTRAWTRAAALNGTPSVSAIVSWDNMSTKTLLSEFVDTFLIWSEEMDEDFERSLPQLRAKPRVIIGSPQFEPIHQGRGLLPRAEFFAKYGLDPSKKLILYTTGSKTLFPGEPTCLEILLLHWQKNLKNRANIMIRMHPKDREGRHAALIPKFPDVPFTLAGANLADDNDWVPTRQDIDLLVNQLHHCDLIVNVASTMTLEGFVIDKPSINIGFTLNSSVSARYPMEDYYQSRHYRDIIESGAAPLVNNYEELFTCIEEVLDRGKFDVETQRQILKQKCSFTHGSSARIDAFLRKFASEHAASGDSRPKPLKVVARTAEDELGCLRSSILRYGRKAVQRARKMLRGPALAAEHKAS